MVRSTCSGSGNFMVFGIRSANIGKRKQAIDAETTPLRAPEDYQHNLNQSDVARVWRPGSVTASSRLDLRASALVENPELKRFAGRKWTLAKVGGPSRPLSTRLSSLGSHCRAL